MIQRIQSLYLFVSALLGVVCLSMPLGYFCTEGERVTELYNLWMRVNATGEHSFAPWVLFALLTIASTLTCMDIFLFRRRALQMRVAAFCIILLVGYYAFLAVFVYLLRRDGLAFTPSVLAGFPFASIVLDYLAFRGILKDEMLVRSLDRLR